MGINDTWFRYRGRSLDLNTENKNGIYDGDQNTLNRPYPSSGCLIVYASKYYVIQRYVTWDFKEYIRLGLESVWQQISTK